MSQSDKQIKSTYTPYLTSIVLVSTVVLVSFFFRDWIGYQVVALMLLVTVSMLAMFFEIRPVLVAAILSAVIWNFFFIPPTFTFHIGNAEDILLFLMYFIIAMVNAVMTFKIREQAREVRDKEDKEKTIRLYNTLFNSLSHELRTPISTIIGAVDILRDNLHKLPGSQQEQLLNEIDMAGIRLNRQVENLLNMSRLETGMLQPKYDWCDVTELIYTVLHKLSPHTTRHQISFHPPDTLPLFKPDIMMLEQILHNLVYNALQYTPDGTQIDIVVKVDQEDLVIFISDNGPGFPESEMELVFEKFYRLPHSKAGGTGLGLSIAKGFAKALKGDILLENLHGNGCRFTVRLPVPTSYINQLSNE